MSYKRCLFLLRSVRFDVKEHAWSEGKPINWQPYDPFWITSWRTRGAYSVGEFVTINEKLEAFRGHCSFIQYIPNKPAKYVMKRYAFCDSKNFFTSNLEIYCGKQQLVPYSVSNKPEDVIMRLIYDIVGTNRKITFYNWYTGIPLAFYLLEKRITYIEILQKKSNP